MAGYLGNSASGDCEETETLPATEIGKEREREREGGREGGLSREEGKRERELSIHIHGVRTLASRSRTQSLFVIKPEESRVSNRSLKLDRLG